jgi:hypothetical protein
MSGAAPSWTKLASHYENHCKELPNYWGMFRGMETLDLHKEGKHHEKVSTIEFWWTAGLQVSDAEPICSTDF